MITSFDKFSKPVPSMNIKGETSISTLWGGVLSCLILIVVLAFGVSKSFELIDPRNPQINTITIPGHFSNEDKLLLSDANFKLAFNLWD